MINPEKFLEMLDPSKVFETLGQAKLFDAKAQSKLAERYTDQAFKLVGMYQAETRRAVEFCLGQSEAAMNEGQKLVNEWVSTVAQMNSELVKSVQDKVQEAAKVLELPKTAKVAKAA